MEFGIVFIVFNMPFIKGMFLHFFSNDAIINKANWINEWIIDRIVTGKSSDKLPFETFSV